MSDKIEYSRLIMKRSTVSGDVPTVPPITATTLNDFTPNDIFVGEFFLNAVDDQLWIRTDNGILPIDLSGSTGTTIPTLTQVLFEGNNTGGYNAFKIAREVQGDPKAQKYLAESLKKIISGLK